MCNHVALLNDARRGAASHHVQPVVVPGAGAGVPGAAATLPGAAAALDDPTPMRRLVAVLNKVRALLRRQGQDGAVQRVPAVALPGASAALDEVGDHVALLNDAFDSWWSRSPARQPP